MKKGANPAKPMTITVEIAPTPTSAAKWLNACRERVKEQAAQKSRAA